MKTDGVAIVSGGLDSVTLLHHLVDTGHQPHVMSFYYGQRHSKELEFARLAAEHFSLPWSMIDLDTVANILNDSGSALVNTRVEVPEGKYDSENMKVTVVPNRNMMMASIAASISIAEGGYYIATAVHNGDAAIYPDCRPEFWRRFEKTVKAGNLGFADMDWHVETPFIQMSKADIAQRAAELNVPLDQTWSCYKGGNIHCGRCGTCVERLEAIDAIDVVDLTEYEDKDYWRTVI